MDRHDVDWKGYWPACPTPFTADGTAVDTDALRALLDWYVGEGMHGVFINGTSVAELPRAEVRLDGIVGLRVNHHVNIHVGDLSIRPLTTE